MGSTLRQAPGKLPVARFVHDHAVSTARAQLKSKLDAIVEVAKRYDYDETHAHQVECLAGTLFMELEPLHKLGREERKLLEFAAILHDIGYYLTSKSHHKHAMQMIMMEPLPEFTRSEKLVIANTVRYHRRAWPSPSHTCYAILGERERLRVDLLAPLLRLADGLDKSHKSVVRDLTCRIEKEDDSIVLVIAAGSDCESEIAAAITRSDLFRSVYQLDVKIEQSRQSAAGIAMETSA